MSFFRNPEIKRSILLYLSVAAVLTAAASFWRSEAGVTAGILSAVFIILHFTITYRRYKKISSISQKVDEILHGKNDIYIDTNTEGELSILQSEIGKMTVRLRQQSEALISDKEFLADSIADISHQIRTPLTSVNIIVSMLSDEHITKERRSELMRELNHLLLKIDWLITALLKMSKLDAGTAHFQNTTVSVRRTIEKAVEPLAVLMELKNQKLLCNIDEKVTFYGDISWTAEALCNIIKNCMEHTPDNGGGIIEIEADENVVFTRIIIRDNGTGICEEDIPHLFERFYKGLNSAEDSFGIGLALARMILISENGTIKAENNKYTPGACFTIKFYKGEI